MQHCAHAFKVRVKHNLYCYLSNTLCAYCLYELMNKLNNIKLTLIWPFHRMPCEARVRVFTISIAILNVLNDFINFLAK